MENFTPRKAVALLSKHLQALSVRYGDDEAAYEEVVERLAAPSIASPNIRLIKQLYEQDVRFSLQWMRCGFPQVGMPHRLAASLMGTSISADLLQNVVYPWPAFAVLIPPGLVQIASAVAPWEPDAVWVFHAKDGRRVLVVRSKKNSFIIRDADSVADLADDTGDIPRFGDSLDEDASKAVSAHNERAMRLISRLVIGACIELDQPKHREVIGKGAPKQKPSRTAEPELWTFQITRDVKVDCRPWVKIYLSGKEGTKSSVRTFVRGHHKRHPFGKGSLERKWIHIEPYWRGDGPIAVRTHRL